MSNVNKNPFNVALIIIGDEILSGRTRDSNLQTLAVTLLQKGYFVKQVAIIPDVEEEIINTVNLFRKQYSIVFTSGGIGPTHDDITSKSIAKAFNLPYEINEEAEEILAGYYKKSDFPFNDSRKKMAKMPTGAFLIKNMVSAAPGFKIENVYVLAGIPKIFQSMLEEVIKTLPEGMQMYFVSLIVKGKSEGDIAGILSDAQNKFLDKVFIGSYPFVNEDEKRYNIELIFKSFDKNLADLCKEEVQKTLG